jgi:hypothetical protein
MNEFVIAASIVATVGAALSARVLLHWEFLLRLGVILTALGLLIGLPAGFYYHVRLRRCLIRNSVLPKNWILFPTRHHEHLSPSEWSGLKLWFGIGAAGFFICIAGCFFLFLGAIQ